MSVGVGDDEQGDNMPRPEKVQAVAEIKERLEQANAVFLAEYAGLSVAEQQDLRRGLRSSGAEFKVVKMTLARLAAAELNIDALDDLLLGPTGLAFADDDAVVAAKALKNFAADHEVFSIKGGLLGTEFLTPERVAQLADIEPREVLLAKVAGVMKAPMSNMASLLAALPRGFATALQQLIDRGGDDLAASDADQASEAMSDDTGSADAIAPGDADASAGIESEPEAVDGDEPTGDDAGAAPEDSESSGDDEAADDPAVDDPGAEDSGQEPDDDDETADKAEEE